MSLVDFSTDAEWKRDGYECARENGMVVTDYYGSSTYGYSTHSRIAVDERMFRLCLEARGWEPRRFDPRRQDIHPLSADPKR